MGKSVENVKHKFDLFLLYNQLFCRLDSISISVSVVLKLRLFMEELQFLAKHLPISRLLRLAKSGASWKI